MTVREASAAGAAKLAQAGVGTPALDAALLLASVLDTDRAGVLARYPDPVPRETQESFDDLIDRRASGVCAAYLLGSKEFRGLEFEVTPDVLVPRPDTETLVEAALEALDALSAGGREPVRAIDVCTGSGCVAVALKAERPDALVEACDISDAALAVARRNGLRLLGPYPAGPAFFPSDLLSAAAGPYGLIVSNPPYVPAGDIPGLSAEVRGEPLLALDGGEDGLDLVRRLILEARSALAPGGALLIEAAHEQAKEISRLLQAAGFDRIRSWRDLAGRDRVSGGTLP